MTEQEQDYEKLEVKIHKELIWKLRRATDLTNNRKKRLLKAGITSRFDETKIELTSFNSMLNDCIHIGIDNLKFSNKLEKEYNKSSVTQTSRSVEH